MDIIIIGAGPGGMDTAIQAAASGKDVLLIEKDEIGGTCLNRGCIPTKALLHWAGMNAELSRLKNSDQFSPFDTQCNLEAVALKKDEVVKHLRDGAEQSLGAVKVVKGEASLTGKNSVKVNGTEYTAEKIIIATGSKPDALKIPGADKALNSDDVLRWTKEWNDPIKSITIIGGGVIGVEFATIISSLRPDIELTVVEYCKEILPPFDKEVAKRLRMSLTKKGIKFVTQAKVTSISENKTVVYEKNGKVFEIPSDKVIMATGRKPVFPEGLVETGVEFTPKGIVTDDNYETNIKGIFAIGDVNGKCMLAHAATAQGKKVLGNDINTDVIPSVVFSSPECAMVGLTEEECQNRSLNYEVNKAFFRSNGKAVTMDETEGIVKIIVDKESKKLLGAHIYGPHASDLITEEALVISNGLPYTDITRTVHSHPTLNEVIITALHE